MVELSTNAVDVIRRSLRPPKAVPPQVAAALAALVPLPARYAELERDELIAIDTVLAAGGTWAQIAEVLALGSRQAARQHGQRLRDRVQQRLADQQAAARPADQQAAADAEVPGPPAAAAVPSSVRRQPRRSSRRRRRR
jgi:hypothetical protein